MPVAETTPEWPETAEATPIFAVALADDETPIVMDETPADDSGAEPETADLSRIAPPSVGIEFTEPAAELPDCAARLVRRPRVGCRSTRRRGWFAGRCEWG